MNLVSIDPGKSGAWAIFENGKLVHTYKIRTPDKQRFLSWSELQELSLDLIPYGARDDSPMVVMEAFLDQRMYDQSPKATNTTACNHGMLQATAMLATGGPPVLIPPREWKKGMGLINKGKPASVELAEKLIDPVFLRKSRMKKNNVDIAEAVLIGIYYGRKHLGWDI